MDEKEYGDELFIYAMTLMEEMEAKKMEAQNEEKNEGNADIAIKED